MYFITDDTRYQHLLSLPFPVHMIDGDDIYYYYNTINGERKKDNDVKNLVYYKNLKYQQELFHYED